MIDLRREFDEIIRDFGYPIILQRSSRKIRCSCWNERSQEASPKCEHCLESGWIIQFERHRVFRNDASLATSKPNRSELVSVGNIWIPANTFYFRHTVHPKPGDVIYEVSWSNQRPINIMGVHVINHHSPLRGDGGRIEYHVVATRSVNSETDFVQSVLPSSSKIKNYDIKPQR